MVRELVQYMVQCQNIEEIFNFDVIKESFTHTTHHTTLHLTSLLLTHLPLTTLTSTTPVHPCTDYTPVIFYTPVGSKNYTGSSIAQCRTF
jgi:hypothetical protein